MIEKGRLHPGLKQLHLCKHMHRQHANSKVAKNPL